MARDPEMCRVICTLSLTRTVWLSALRRVCEINSLFKPSFPYDDMSFSELQRAATFGAAPRFTRRLYKSEGDAVTAPLGAFARRVFIPRVTKSSNVASEDAGALKTLDLVPGGRFLIITTDTLVHLWDLGHNATKLIKPHAVASIPLPEPQCEPAISILPTDDGTGIEVMVMAFKLGCVRKSVVKKSTLIPLSYVERSPSRITTSSQWPPIQSSYLSPHHALWGP
jgi:hypothetical protein